MIPRLRRTVTWGFSWWSAGRGVLVAVGRGVPFSPVQIILLELFMDVGAASTFVAERAESDLLRRPPRDARAPFMNGAMGRSIVLAAAGLFAAVAVTYLVTLYSGGGVARAQSMAFVTWLLGHVLLALNLRSEREPLSRRTLGSNRLMLFWGGAALLTALLATVVPWVHAAFGTVALSGREWALAVGVALAGTFSIEVRKRVAPSSHRGRQEQRAG
jgi:P-type Ca2+ transporter type 2C